MVSYGSCFSDRIANKLSESGFQIESNPYGVAFDPISVANQVQSKTGRIFQASSDVFKSWDTQGFVLAKNEVELSEKLDILNTDNNRRVEEADVVFITFGSAWAYVLNEDKSVVANCHKQDQSKFEKTLIDIDSIVEVWNFLISKYRSKQFVITVSPVRHWRHGAHNNNVGKAHLHAAVYKVVSENENAHYFPSFELIMDDLRDYRFFNEDMIHPSSQAIEYVWEHFQDACMSNETRNRVSKYLKLSKLEAHKPSDSSGPAFEKWKNKIRDLKRDLGDTMQ